GPDGGAKGDSAQGRRPHGQARKGFERLLREASRRHFARLAEFRPARLRLPIAAVRSDVVRGRGLVVAAVLVLLSGCARPQGAQATPTPTPSPTPVAQ